MKFKIQPAIVAALVLYGCGDDGSSTYDEPPSPIIEFHDPVTDWREITTMNISEFRVCAKERNGWKTFMDNVVVKRIGTNKWTYSPPVDWPGTKVDFLAVSPVDINIDSWHRSFQLENSGKEDVVIATMMGVSQTEGRLRLNFTHSMAQIVISMYTARTDVNALVKKLEITDIATVGKFIFPTRSTTASGTGSNVSTNWEYYNLNQTSMTIFESDKAEGDSLNPIPEEYCSTGIRYFIPITFSPLELTPYVHGSAIKITYRLTGKDSDETVWPDDSTAKILKTDDGWGISYISLLQNTRDGRWRSNMVYRYNIAVNGPSE